MSITPEQLLAAYANGYFPMAMSKDDPELYWFSPEERGVLSIAGFNIPRGLKRAMKMHNYTITVNRDFDAVIRGCASVGKGRNDTWINETIIDLYTALHRSGHAHSVEVWGVSPPPLGGRVGGGASGAAKDLITAQRVDATSETREKIPNPQPPIPVLLGGLYGISLGGAFFGESMFSRAADASKIALVNLVGILEDAGYSLLDTQYVNEHLKQFGVMPVPKQDYMTKLEKALSASPNPSTLFSTVSVRRGLASSSSESLT